MEDPRRQLQAEVARLTRIGYELNHQTDASVHLFRPKRFSLMWFILTLGFLYMVHYISSYDEHVFLWVEDGKLKRSGTIRGLGPFILDKFRGHP